MNNSLAKWLIENTYGCSEMLSVWKQLSFWDFPQPSALICIKRACQRWNTIPMFLSSCFRDLYTMLLSEECIDTFQFSHILWKKLSKAKTVILKSVCMVGLPQYTVLNFLRDLPNMPSDVQDRCITYDKIMTAYINMKKNLTQSQRLFSHHDK